MPPSVERQLRPGDILGFSSYDWLGAGINLGSLGIPFWSISHVAIVGRDGLIFESTTDGGCPCVIKGTLRGVQAHEAATRVATYPGRVYHYQLTRPLYGFERRRLNDFLLSHLGRDYDELGAFRTGGVAFSWLESLFRGENLSRIFCSEYAAAALREIGYFYTDNVSRWSPNKLIRCLRNKQLILPPVRLR